MRVLAIFLIVVVAASLVEGRFAVGQQKKERTEVDKFADVLGREAVKAKTKAIASAAYILAKKLPANQRRAAMDQVRRSIQGMEGEAIENFLTGLKRMSQDKLQDLASNPNGLRAYGATIMDSVRQGSAKINANQLKKIIGYSGDAVDEAGVRALKLLNSVDDALTKTGKLPKKLAAEFASAIKNLPAAKTKAIKGLINLKDWAKKPAGDAITGPLSIIGTSVDGAFVLWDAYKITQLDTAEEKVAAAAGTGVGYGMDVVGGVAITASGGGVLPLVVLGWSSSKVNELVNEAIMLEYEQADAEAKEARARIEMRLYVLDGLIKADRLLKKGKVREADLYVAKLQSFFIRHFTEMDSTEGLGERLEELKKRVQMAEKQLKANELIRTANRSYQEASSWLKRNRRLAIALKQAQTAVRVLESEPSLAEFTAPALARAKDLVNRIKKRIAEADQLQATKVLGPTKLAPGERATFVVKVRGGVPDYDPVQPEGQGYSDEVAFYYTAPEKLGEVTLQFKLKDDLGKQTSISHRVAITNDKDAESGPLKSYGWAVWKEKPRKPGLVDLPPQLMWKDAIKVPETADATYGILSELPSGTIIVFTVNGKEYQRSTDKSFKCRLDHAGKYKVSAKVFQKDGTEIGEVKWETEVYKPSDDVIIQ